MDVSPPVTRNAPFPLGGKIAALPIQPACLLQLLEWYRSRTLVSLTREISFQLLISLLMTLGSFQVQSLQACVV